MTKELTEKEKRQRYLKLCKIEESKEWKEFVEKYKNKAENYEENILAELENNTIDKEIKYSEDDLIMARIILFKEVKEDLPELDWIEYFVELIDDIIKLLYNNIKRGITTQQWVALSKPNYTIKEYRLTQAIEYWQFDNRLFGLINSYKKEEEKEEEEVY